MVFVLVVMDVAPLIHINQFFQVILHVANIAHYLVQAVMVIFYSGVLIFNRSDHPVRCSVALFNTSIDYIIKPSHIFLDVLEGVLDIF